MDIEEIFPGKWVKDDEYLIRCPVCGEPGSTHDHCYVNPDKKVFKCWKCGKGGHLDWLLRNYGDGIELEPRTVVKGKQGYPPVDFSRFRRVTGTLGTMDRLAYGYLLGRGLNKEEIEKYDIRYSESGRYYGRVLFPIYEEGVLVCFSARSFINWVVPKYLFPHTGETPLTTSECVWNIDDAEFKLGAIVCEGILDAIAVNRFLIKEKWKAFGVVSILSKNLSNGQLKKLLKMNSQILILLDADAYKDSVKIAKQFHAYGKGVLVASLEKGDPADNSLEELERVVCEAKEYDLEMEVSLL